jgi:hypothetical protein
VLVQWTGDYDPTWEPRSEQFKGAKLLKEKKNKKNKKKKRKRVSEDAVKLWHFDGILDERPYAQTGRYLCPHSLVFSFIVLLLCCSLNSCCHIYLVLLRL